MSDENTNNLALLRARLNATRLSAQEAHRTVTGQSTSNAHDLLPFLDACAREMEETAALIRAAADAAAHPAQQGCSG